MKGVTNKHGVTLIEMLVVIAIIGVLASIIIPSTVVFIERARETTAKQEANSLANLVYMEWKLDHNDNVRDKDFYAHLLEYNVLKEGTGILPTWHEGSFSYENGFYYLSSNERVLRVDISGFNAEIELIGDIESVLDGDQLPAVTELPSSSGDGALIGDYHRDWNTPLISDVDALGWRALTGYALVNKENNASGVATVCAANADALGIDMTSTGDVYYSDLDEIRKLNVMNFILLYRETLGGGFTNDDQIQDGFTVGVDYQWASIHFIDAVAEGLGIEDAEAMREMLDALATFLNVEDDDLIRLNIDRLEYFITLDSPLQEAIAENIKGHTTVDTVLEAMHVEMLVVQLEAMKNWDEQLTIFDDRDVYPYLAWIDEKSLHYGNPDDYEKILKDTFAMVDGSEDPITMQTFDAFFIFVLDFRYETGAVLTYMDEEMSTEDDKAKFLNHVFDAVLETIDNVDWDTYHIHDDSIDAFRSTLTTLRDTFQTYSETDIDDLITSLMAEETFTRYADVIAYLQSYSPS